MADLRELIAKRQIVVICGAGVSLAATGGEPVAAWKGLLQSGVRRCMDWGASEAWVERQLRNLDEGDTDEWIHVASLVTKKLGGPEGGEYKKWLRETVGALKVTDTSLLQAIHALGCPIATTNYDHLLESATGLRPVSWDEPSEVERALRRDDRRILHLHGHWESSTSVVFGLESYFSVRDDGHAAAVRTLLRTGYSLLFIGCGDTTEDPNIGAWLAWSGRVFAGSEYRSYRLEKDADVARVQRLHPLEQRIRVLGYGPHHADLPAFLRSLAPQTSAPVIPAPPAPDPLILLRQQLRERAEHLPWLEGTVGLSDIYVQVQVEEHTPALRGEVSERAVMTLREALRARQGRRGGPGPRLALVGAAGSGKSTLLKQLTVELIDDGATLPLIFHAEQLLAHERWEDAFRQTYGSAPLPAATTELNAGRTVMLIDGLDEAGHREGLTASEAVSRWASAIGATALIVASREEGFSLPPGFTRLDVLPMEDPEDQRRLLIRLGVPEDRASEAIAALSEDEGRKVLLQNPLLLTLVGQVLLRHGVLPRHRADLYEQAIRCLVEREVAVAEGRRAVIRSPALTRAALEHVCGHLHSTPDPWTAEAICTALETDQALCRRLDRSFGDPESWLAEQAKKVGLLVRMGGPRGDGYGLFHRTLREYLAACGLVRACEAARWPEAPPPALASTLAAAKVEPGTWAETLALATARAGALHPERVDRLLAWIVDVGDLDVAWRAVEETARISAETALALWRLGRGSRDWQRRFEERSHLLKRLPALLGDARGAAELVLQLARESTHGADLFWAWEVLRGLGREDLAGRVFREHRPEARSAVLAEIARRGWWKRIPAGSFWMGSPKKEAGRWANEGPRHRVEVLRAFELLAVPVMNTLYERFDPGHAADREEFKEYGEGIDLRSQAEVPVYKVSWYESVAFARWLSAGDAPIRLPSEVEWEYACRGGTETRFWSGDEDEDLYAVDWVGQNSGGHPYPVATPPTPRGHQHPWGLYDLHGNVWEWCADAWAGSYEAWKVGRRHDPAAEPGTGEPAAPRVFRGGSWASDARNARSACRSGRFPRARSQNRGFRLVCISPE